MELEAVQSMLRPHWRSIAVTMQISNKPIFIASEVISRLTMLNDLQIRARVHGAAVLVAFSYYLLQ